MQRDGKRRNFSILFQLASSRYSRMLKSKTLHGSFCECCVCMRLGCEAKSWRIRSRAIRIRKLTHATHVLFQRTSFITSINHQLFQHRNYSHTVLVLLFKADDSIVDDFCNIPSSGLTDRLSACELNFIAWTVIVAIWLSVWCLLHHKIDLITFWFRCSETLLTISELVWQLMLATSLSRHTSAQLMAQNHETYFSSCWTQVTLSWVRARTTHFAVRTCSCYREFIHIKLTQWAASGLLFLLKRKRNHSMNLTTSLKNSVDVSTWTVIASIQM